MTLNLHFILNLKNIFEAAALQNKVVPKLVVFKRSEDFPMFKNTTYTFLVEIL